MKKKDRIIPYHVHCQHLHKEAVRRKRKKKWLRNTPLHLRGWYRMVPAPKEFDETAPKDFRFLENTKDCAHFFQRIRNVGNFGKHHMQIDLSSVEHIDFASTMLLSAIGEELQNKDCDLSGNTPRRQSCKRYLIESGFYNKMFDRNGRRFQQANNTEFITVERGQFKLTKDHYAAFRRLIKHINLHLIGKPSSKRVYSTIIKEICANSIEWSEADKSQWTIGAKFEDDKVIIVILDLGKGILEKLYRDYWDHIKDVLSFKNDAAVLFGAFEQKYGSTTQEVNRNQGLPCVKAAFDDGHVKNLKVVTNNSKIDFTTNDNNMFSIARSTFNGTLYSWRMDADCLTTNNQAYGI